MTIGNLGVKSNINSKFQIIDMLLLNLDKDFKPLNTNTSNEIEFEIFNFPSGCEPHIKILIEDEDLLLYKRFKNYPIIITTRIHSMNDLMILLLATDALKRLGLTNIELFLPFLPFARQDRVMVKGEPLSIKVFADIINSQNYKKVTIFDAHSDVSCALINNCVNVPNYNFIKSILSPRIENNQEDFLIISPDAGASKKIFNICKYIGYKNEIIQCNKTRNVETGHLTGVSIPTHDFQSFDLYILDDICDGAGTFVMLAKELKKRNCGKINLIVSHGIFSKGVELENINHIYTTNSFKDFEMHDDLTQIKLDNHILDELLIK